MSLKEKLSKITKEIEETEAESEKKAQEKLLEPILIRIQQLENQKNLLETVKSSLGLESSKETGKGMREYSKETIEDIEKENITLDTLVENNKKAVESLGIKDRADLLSNSEFANEPEIVKYKKVTEQAKDLEEADIALQERLVSLGINIGKENFSYDSVEKALTEKIQSVEGLLLQEKLKTPKGREEAAEILAKELEVNISRSSFSEDSKTGSKTIYLEPHIGEILISGEKTKINNWKYAELLPKNFNDLRRIYGSEVVVKALNKAYEYKIDDAFKQFDKDAKNIDETLKKNLERSSPEKWNEAREKIKEFNSLKQLLEETLQEKAKALKEKNVDFNPVYVQNYGGTYEKYGLLTDEKYYNDFIEETIREPDQFPPKLYFDALKEYVEKRIAHIKELIEDIKKLETKEDVFNFTEKENKGISKAHKNILKTDFKEIVRPQKNSWETSWDQLIVKGLENFKSYYEASRYFEKVSQERQNIKEKFLEVLKIAVDADIKRQELKKEIKNLELGEDINVNDMDSFFDRLEVNRNSATTLLEKLTVLESQLPSGLIILYGKTIEVSSVSSKMKELRESQKKAEEDLKDTINSIKIHEQKRPKIIGKRTWQETLDEYKAKQKDIEKKISVIPSEVSNLYRKQYFYIPDVASYDIEKIVKDQKQVQGEKDNIFSELKAQLEPMVKIDLPVSMVQLYKEYQDLVRKIT